jgi:hypothetical protein
MTDEVHAILAAAAADVEKAEVPDDLRSAAFTAAITLRTASAGTAAGAPAAGGRRETPARSAEDWQSAVATALGVDIADVGEAFDLVEGHMRLTIPPSRLPRQKAAAMRDVALLVCTARQTAGLEEDGFTSVGVIRDECRDLGVLDANNFAAEIGKLDDVMSFRGTGRSRDLKVNRRGFEEAGRRLRDLLQSD